MEMVAHNPKMAKKVGVPKSVGEDFVAADKGKKFGAGSESRVDSQKANKQKTNHGSTAVFKEGGMMKHEDMKMDKKVVKKAVGMHDKQQHGGKKTNLTTLKSGGMCGGGKAMKKMAKGGGIEVKGKTRGKMC